MDRRAKKLEKKRKDRDQAKKKAHAVAARKPTESALLARSAAREKFGPCFVSAGWDDTESPDLVTVLVTRQLPGGRFVLATALVDRTCLGIKNGMVLGPMPVSDLSEIIDKLGRLHGAMIACEPLVVQSVVFHAVDYARSLGFEPHRDFEPLLFGPRPEALLDTPWSKEARPIYMSGPHDSTGAVLKALTNAVGAEGFDLGDGNVLDDDYTDEDLYGDDSEDDGALVYSPLARGVMRNEVALEIAIYRQRTAPGWTLEVENDETGASMVWDETFETDGAALEAALLAIERGELDNAPSATETSDEPAS